MNDIKQFKKEYDRLARKHNLDFFAYTECSNRFLRFLIKLVGEKKLISRIGIKKWR